MTDRPNDNKMEQTMYFKVNKEDELNPRDVLLAVYDAVSYTHLASCGGFKTDL